MRWLRYLFGSVLAFLIIATITIMVSGFILLDTWGRMEANSVLRPAQGGNSQIIISNIILLASTFLAMALYLRLKKAEHPLIFGPVIGIIYSATTLSNYFFYITPTLKVPIYILLQNIIGFTIGTWIFRHAYFKK